MPELRRMELLLDEHDHATIQAEIAARQARERWPDADGGTVLPEGQSNLAGAILAEVIRDLAEYRALYERDHPVSSED